MNKNENVNEMRNLRAFDEDKDSMTYGEFSVNDFSLASDDEIKTLTNHGKSFNIKLKSNYLKVTYNLKLNIILLSITVLEDSYEYNFYQLDNRKDSIYLEDKFYDPNHAKKFTKGLYRFENSYSKDFILSNNQLINLKINRLIGLYESKTPIENKDKKLENNYIRDSKKAIFRKFIS